MLTVDEDEFWKDMQPLDIAGLPAMQVKSGRLGSCCAPALRCRRRCRLALLHSCFVSDHHHDGVSWRSKTLASLPPQSEVSVVGFPQGGDNVCVTKGVVSRIDRCALDVHGPGQRGLLGVSLAPGFDG